MSDLCGEIVLASMAPLLAPIEIILTWNWEWLSFLLCVGQEQKKNKKHENLLTSLPVKNNKKK